MWNKELRHHNITIWTVKMFVANRSETSLRAELQLQNQKVSYTAASLSAR